jgi:tetratricopeptide (TPR) repeat protein
MRKILAIAPAWHSGLYYLGVLQAKLGKVNSAVDIFKKLLEHSDRYFLIIALDPALNGVRRHLNLFLNRELEQIRSRCADSFESITATFNEIKKWFSETDPEYRTARELYRKCSAHMHEKSISGLLDIISAETDIDIIFRRAVEQRRRLAEDQVARFKNVHADFTRYLERYPYKQALNPDDVALRDGFKTIFDATRRAIDTISLQRLQEARPLVEKLAAGAAKISSARQRLDITRNLYFIFEFSFRLAVSFFGTGIAAAIVFTLLLSAYQVYSGSFSSLTFEAFAGYVRYGLIVGFFSGLAGAAVWFKKRFREMYAKLNA